MLSRSQKIAVALNSARATNITGHDDQLQEFISEYLWEDHSDSSESESEEEDEVVYEEQLVPQPVTDITPDRDDAPLVEINGPQDPFLHSADQETERKKVESFSCRCKHVKVVTGASSDGRNGCCTQFSIDEILSIRLDWSSMTSGRKDDVMIGLMLAQQINEDGLKKRAGQKEVPQRTLTRTSYVYRGKIVCRETFKFLLVISQNKLTAVKKHVLEHGAADRIKKTKAPRANALTSKDVQRIVLFLRGYAEDHALVLPGRVKGISRTDVRLLPSSHTKFFVHQQYVKSAADTGFSAVSLSSFKREWRNYTPEIVVSRPMSDLCWTCQENNTKIYRSSGMLHEEKELIIQKQMDHLAAVTAERSYYNHLVEAARVTVQAQQIRQLRPCDPNSQDFSMHYSFDYAQQVHLPSNPMQPGPIYFLVPRKCGIFGVNCEAIPQQINFLIDEGMCSGKGSNAVISYLHFFFENYGLGEKHVHLHCDNCAGQNKNQHVLHYLAWRVMTGRHTKISLHFMLPGHTKFAPDWCFGLLKKKFRTCHVSSLQELEKVVDESTHKGINRPQLVGDETGQVFVPTYDWQGFFKQDGRPFAGIKSLQHFTFSDEEPGICRAYSTLTSEPLVKRVLLPTAAGLTQATVIPPPGLSFERLTYLFNNIRQFVKDKFKDLMCPSPNRAS